VIRRDTKKLYARDACFRDGYKEIKGVDAIWVMMLTIKRDKDNPIEVIGMSHVRFAPDGKIIFHTDYWDTSVIFERAPVIGSIIRWAKEQF